MGVAYNTSVVLGGLVQYMDAANPKSYPGSGTTWYDLSGQKINGTMSGITYNGSPSYYMGYAAASSSTIDLGPNFNFTTESFTISLWLYVESFTTSVNGQTPVPFYKGGFNANGYYTQLTAGGTVFFHTSQSGADQSTSSSSGAIPLTTWKQLTFVRSGASVIIYSNGVNVTASAGTHINPASSSSNFTLGSYGASIYPSMRISNFSIYNLALSAADVNQNFNALRGRYGL